MTNLTLNQQDSFDFFVLILDPLKYFIVFDVH